MAMSCLAGVLLVAAVSLGGASAQSSTGGGGCTAALVSLSPCLGYITGNETAASESCCSQLKTVVQSEPQCLCVALNADPASLGLAVNRTRALGLPEQCKVQTPPVSKCNNGAAAPTSPSSGTTPAGTGSGGGSTATPTAYLGSNGVSLRGSVGLVVGIAAVTVYTVSAV